jgi:GWxTD domain-containing protein
MDISIAKYSLKFTLLHFCLILCSNLNAQVETSILSFRLSDGSAYSDILIDIPGDQMEIQNRHGVWSSTAEITVIAEKSGEIFSVKKTVLDGPQTPDSLVAYTSNHLHLERLLLDKGNYQITIKVEGSTTTEITEDISISLSGAPEVSDIMLVEAYMPSNPNESSDFSRSGYDMMPLVSNVISPFADQLRFYTELYNIHEVVGRDSLFLLVVGLTDSEGKMDPNTTRYLRLNASEVVPVFEVVPVSITTPPISGGMLRIEVKTRDGHSICSKECPVDRWKKKDDSGAMMVDFADEWKDRGLLYRHLEDHLPLASPSQQNTIMGVLKVTEDISILQGFLEQFWIRRNPENPEESWRNYASEISVVDSVFGGCRSGHGADTDQGYVYLKYGRPNTVVQRHHDTDYYPYEIWHYHHTSGFTNRRFLFFAPHVVLECFEILHSDMPGEIKNQDWLQMLKSRENRVKVTDSQLNRLNPRNTFSGEEPEDLFYNPR